MVNIFGSAKNAVLQPYKHDVGSLKGRWGIWQNDAASKFAGAKTGNWLAFLMLAAVGIHLNIIFELVLSILFLDRYSKK